MARFKKMYAPAGTDEVNIGTDRFSVERDGTVMVPEESTGPLLATAGLRMDEDVGDTPDGMVVITHPTASGCSWDGKSYAARSDGSFVVPVGAVNDLLAHGFVGGDTAVDAEVMPAAPADSSPPKLKIPTK